MMGEILPMKTSLAKSGGWAHSVALWIGTGGPINYPSQGLGNQVSIKSMLSIPVVLTGATGQPHRVSNPDTRVGLSLYWLMEVFNS